MRPVTTPQTAYTSPRAPVSAAPTSCTSRDECALRAHAQDLGGICRAQRRSRSIAVWSRRNIVVAFLSFLVGGARAYLWTLVVSPASVLFDPLSTLATLVLYPLIALGLAALVAALYIFSLVGGGRVVDWLSSTYANGWSIVNWVRSFTHSLACLDGPLILDARRRRTRPSLALAA